MFVNNAQIVPLSFKLFVSNNAQEVTVKLQEKIINFVKNVVLMSLKLWIIRGCVSVLKDISERMITPAKLADMIVCLVWTVILVKLVTINSSKQKEF